MIFNFQTQSLKCFHCIMITHWRLQYVHLHQFPGHEGWVYHTMLNIMAHSKWQHKCYHNDYSYELSLGDYNYPLRKGLVSNSLVNATKLLYHYTWCVPNCVVSWLWGVNIFCFVAYYTNSMISYYWIIIMYKECGIHQFKIHL